MYNLKGMNEARKQFADADKHRPKGDREFDFLEPRDLADGDYYFRLWPKHPQHNPKGVRCTGRHFLETKIGGKKKMVTCMAPENEYCYFCDIYKILDKAKFFENPKIDQGVRDAATGLAPAIQFLFVTSWMVYEDKTSSGEGEEKREYKKYRPAPFGAEHEHGKFFAVKSQTILDEIQKLLQGPGGRELTEGDELGSYLIFKKRGNRYSVELSDQTEIEIQNQDLVKKYPTSMMKMGDKNKMSPAQSSAWIQDRDQCWWGYKLEKYVDLSVDDDEPVEPETETDD